MSFFEKRKKRKLYQQWVDKSGLPEENIPVEYTSEGVAGEEPWEEERGGSQPRGSRVFIIHVSTRQLLILLLIIAALLVLSTTLVTVLIMRSC